ncbi:MAG: tetratricopeptide repeat protein [Nostoc sp.]
MIHYNRADTDRAASWAAQMVEAMEQGGSRQDKASALQLQGHIAGQRQNWAEAERLYKEALAIYRELEEEQDEAIALNNLGLLARSQGDYDRAKSYYKQALAIAEKQGNKESQATYCDNLGLLALARSPYSSTPLARA